MRTYMRRAPCGLLPMTPYSTSACVIYKRKIDFQQNISYADVVYRAQYIISKRRVPARLVYIFIAIYNFDFVSAAAAADAEMRECAGSSSFDRVCKCLIITVTSFGSWCCCSCCSCGSLLFGSILLIVLYTGYSSSSCDMGTALLCRDMYRL